MKNDYLYTNLYTNTDELDLKENSIYFYGISVELRSKFVEDLIKKHTGFVTFINISLIDLEFIKEENSGQILNLRNGQSISAFLKNFGADLIYIDATGLDNKICASFLKNSINNIKEVRVIYAEPEKYDIKQFKAESVFNDLSEKIDGIFPLPGFASIFPQEEDFLLVAFVGFEGGRFSHMLEAVQPSRENVIPVIGVPGFRPEYPFVAYWGNRTPLKETDTWRKVKFAAANSMVEVYMLLKDLIYTHPSTSIKLAPIGTKPHAIAAMLFAIKYPRNVEIVYDNPKRNRTRTEGLGKIVECLVTKLLTEN